MKKRIIIIYSVLAVLICSCEDFLDRQPLVQYSERSLWSSVDDAYAALNGCYRGWENGTRLFYMDTGSDNAFNAYPDEGFIQYGNMVLLTPNRTNNNLWNFNTIQVCNWFLAGIDKASVDEELSKRMKGEARFLRAYKYFVMSQLYGDVPLILTNITTEEANAVTKTSKLEVVNFVLDELNAISEDLPVSYSGSDKGRITKGAVLSLRARVELYNEKFEECIVTCQEIMELGVYELFPSYADLFRIQNEYNSEIILEIGYLENDVPLTSLGRNALHIEGGGWYSINPVQSLVDAYEMNNGRTIDDPLSGYDPEQPHKNRDPRLQATVTVPGDLINGIYFNPLEPGTLDYWNRRNYSGYASRKYVSHLLSDFKNIWNVGLNLPLIRYAEVLLTYAEAKIELDQIDLSVYEAIDDVRQRVGMPVVDQTIFNTQEKMRELIRRERRVELAMEGLRWYDIQRWRIGNEVMNGPCYGSRLGTVNPSTGEVSYSTTRILCETRIFDETKNYLWPIPQTEIDKSPNLIQNPGY